MEKFTRQDIEEHKQCEVTQVIKVSETKKKIVQCTKETAYRVIKWGERKYLIEGGDASKAEDYKVEQTEAAHFVCRSHFKHLYLFAEKRIFAGECPSEFMELYEYGRYTGKWTFRRFVEGKP